MDVGDRIAVGMTAAGIILALQKEKKDISDAPEFKGISWVDSDFTIEEIKSLMEQPFHVDPAPMQVGNGYIALHGGDLVAWDTGLFNAHNYVMECQLEGPIRGYYDIDVEALEKVRKKIWRDCWKAYGLTLTGVISSSVFLGKAAAEIAARKAAEQAGKKVAEEVAKTAAQGLGSFLAGVAAGVGIGVQLYGVLVGFGVKEETAEASAWVAGVVLGTVACFPPAGTIVAMVASLILAFVSIFQTVKAQLVAQKNLEIATENMRISSSIAYAHVYQPIAMLKHLKDRITIYEPRLADLLYEVISEYVTQDGTSGKLITAITDCGNKCKDRADKDGVIDHCRLGDFTELYETYNQLIKDVIKTKVDYGFEYFDEGLHSEAKAATENLFSCEEFKTIVNTREYMEEAHVSFRSHTEQARTFFKILAERYALIHIPSTVGGRQVPEKKANFYQTVLPFSKENKTYRVEPYDKQNLPEMLQVTAAVSLLWETMPKRSYTGKDYTRYVDIINNYGSANWFERNLSYDLVSSVKRRSVLAAEGYRGVSYIREDYQALTPSIGTNAIHVDAPFAKADCYRFSTLSTYAALYEGKGGVDSTLVPLVVRSDKWVKVTVEDFDESVPVLPGSSINVKVLEFLEEQEEINPTAPIVASYMFAKGRVENIQTLMELLSSGFTFGLSKENIYKFPGIALECEFLENDYIPSVIDMTVNYVTRTEAIYALTDSKPRQPNGFIGDVYTSYENHNQVDLRRIEEIREELRKKRDSFFLSLKLAPHTQYVVPVLVPTDDGHSLANKDQEVSPFSVASGGISVAVGFEQDLLNHYLDYYSTKEKPLKFYGDVLVMPNMRGVGICFKDNFTDVNVLVNSGKSYSKAILPTGIVATPPDESISAFLGVAPMIPADGRLICI